MRQRTLPPFMSGLVIMSFSSLFAFLSGGMPFIVSKTSVICKSTSTNGNAPATSLPVCPSRTHSPYSQTFFCLKFRVYINRVRSPFPKIGLIPSPQTEPSPRPKRDTRNTPLTALSKSPLALSNTKIASDTRVASSWPTDTILTTLKG